MKQNRVLSYELLELGLIGASNNSRPMFDPPKIKSLEEIMRLAACDVEDVVELIISHTIKGLKWKCGKTHKILHRNLLSIVRKMDSTKKQVDAIVSDLDDHILQLSGGSLSRHLDVP
ncbi:hypothetical protein CQW23_09078 [Capsicum baccatum]|uniref:Uncharacterized protein n=1 Tax=Capsicum baccatum TaxID=33114 RepID=A0A2G2XAT4_CAPBA|nr:hypothetical protein CQW23_09078 [Capsicum baccatum]